MKPYGKNDKERVYKRYNGRCDCYYCVPVKKSTKKSERNKIKKELAEAKKRR